MKNFASGPQIAVLTFAVTLLSVPIGNYLMTGNLASTNADPLILRALPFLIFGLLLVTVPPLRIRASRCLSGPIPRGRYGEILVVALTTIPLTWATAGARALWAWIIDPASIECMKANSDSEWLMATSARGIATFLVLGVMVAPLLEELLFRGFLYRAFTRDWGWVRALLATSALFGLYHPFFLNAFVASIVFVCVLRRTGSLRASILVHAFMNLAAWWPFMGQYVFPSQTRSTSDLSTWSVNLIALAIAVVAVPLYVWMSRDRNVTAPTAILEPNAALPK